MKLPYSEGSVFLVPLEGGGYGRGVVARMAPKGKVLFGYFFGPRLISQEEAVLEGLRPEKAILRIHFGDLGLMNGEWRVLGMAPEWRRSEWPMPHFVRRDPTGRMKPRLVEYSDNNPNEILSERVIDDNSSLQTDSLSGYVAAAIKLEKLLK